MDTSTKNTKQMTIEVKVTLRSREFTYTLVSMKGVIALIVVIVFKWLTHFIKGSPA